MKEYTQRTYRQRVWARDLASFQVSVKETDLLVISDKNFSKEATDLILESRHQIESYIKSHPDFLTTLKAYPKDLYAPPLVREMIASTNDIQVGPMAAVAGAIAQFVAEGLLDISEQVIVENGGDVFLKTDRPATVSIFAGDSPLSEKIGLIISPEQMPLGVCSSSGKVGHSLSMGASDAVCLLSKSAARADGAATALGNMIKSKKDLRIAAEFADKMQGIMGGVVIMDEQIATWGDIEITGL